MLKKSITYIDYDGNKQTDECYFNLSKQELVEMQVSENGGFDKYISKLIEEKDTRKIYSYFKELVLMSYGQKSYDGKHFIKKMMRDGQMIRLRDEFEQTEAFSELMMELIGGGEKAISDFVNKLIPSDLAEEVEKKVSSGEIKFPGAE